MAARPKMAVPRGTGIPACEWGFSSTGILACVNFSCANSRMDILEEQFAIRELLSKLCGGLRQHSQEWLCHESFRKAFLR